MKKNFIYERYYLPVSEILILKQGLLSECSTRCTPRFACPNSAIAFATSCAFSVSLKCVELSGEIMWKGRLNKILENFTIGVWVEVK